MSRLGVIVMESQAAASILTPPVLDEIVEALNEQEQHKSALTGRAPRRIMRADGVAAAPNGSVTVCHVVDKAPEPGILGFHDRNPDGSSYIEICAPELMKYGATAKTGANSFSCTFSHEFQEDDLDPPANLWAEDNDGIEHALESSDATEADSYDSSTGVALSNFLTMRWFTPGATKAGGALDYMGLCSSAFERRPGGYEILRTASTDIHTATSRIMSARGLTHEEHHIHVRQTGGYVVLAHFPKAWPTWKHAHKPRKGGRPHRRGLVFA